MIAIELVASDAEGQFAMGRWAWIFLALFNPARQSRN
jgi:hypothetical protein